MIAAPVKSVPGIRKSTFSSTGKADENVLFYYANFFNDM